MKLPEYTNFQKNIIRREINLLRKYGLGDTVDKCTYLKIIEEVGIYTNMPLEDPGIASNNFSSAEQLSLNQKYVRGRAEKLAAFMRNPNRQPPKSGEPVEGVLQYVVGYLCHPEIARLTPKQFSAPDIVLDAGARLAKYIWSGEDVKNCMQCKTDGSYQTQSIWKGRKVQHSLDFEKTDHPCLFSVLEQFESENRKTEINHGWIVIFPNQRIEIYLQEFMTSKTIDRSGYLKEESIHIIQHNMLQLLTETEDKSVTIDKVEIINKFIHNKYINTIDNNNKKSNEVSKSIDLSGDFKNILIGMTDETTEKLLFEAFKKLDLKLFEELILSGADVNYKNSETGRTILHEIAWLGRVEELRIIIKRDDLDYLTKDKQGRDAVELSIFGAGNPLITEFLNRKSRQQWLGQKTINNNNPEPSY